MRGVGDLFPLFFQVISSCASFLRYLRIAIGVCEAAARVRRRDHRDSIFATSTRIGLSEIQRLIDQCTATPRGAGKSRGL